MQTTQLACPHCGSMVNLSGAIAPGTPVNCLICMQSFAAHPIAVTTVAPTTPVPTAPKPQAGILVGKSLAAVKPVRTRPARHSSPSAKPAASGSKTVLWMAALTLFTLVAATAGFAIWKHLGHNPADQAGQQFAAGEEPNDGASKAPGDQPKKKGAASNIVAPADDGLTDEDILRKKKEEQKNLLKRKPTANGGPQDPDLDPVTTFDVPMSTVPGVEPGRVNAAVEKGVAFLKGSQAANGGWNANGYAVGATALGGLTLLECKRPANDPHVQRAANFVRGGALNLSMTYEISLSVLFLDRLGDPRDRALIQGLALRLLAGQHECGGWTYDCPPLNAKDMFQLYAFLRSHHPAAKAPAKKDKDVDLKVLGKKANDGGDAIDEFGKMVADKEAENDPKDPPPVHKKAPAAVKKNPMRAEMLSPQLRMYPVVRNQDKSKGNLHLRFGAAGGDNSNTQFALLALWAARRHAIPSDVALLTAYQRFVVCQSLDFGWGYHALGMPYDATNTMTCVGLLGMAMGHGVAPEVVKADANDPKKNVTKSALQDPRISNGLKKLAKYLGDVAPDKDNVGAMENMYFLWSTERVAVLYDLNTIDGKDWYGYGAQKLLKYQSAPGDWPSAHYPGTCSHVNTCFALLFLKRSNLVSDLTLHLRLANTQRDPQK